MKSTYLSFTLNMPSRGSWNGKWSGENYLFVIIKKFNGKKGRERANKVLEKSYHHYSWSDGWAAGIDIKEINGEEAKGLKRRSQGFCGYDWMVDSILERGEIIG